MTFDEPNPFVNTTEGAPAVTDEQGSVAYRYRRWKLDGDTYLVARCEVHAVSDVKGQRSFMTLNALNEFDPKHTGVDWRQKLETQRGAVLATELKNNANKLARYLFLFVSSLQWSIEGRICGLLFVWTFFIKYLRLRLYVGKWSSYSLTLVISTLSRHYYVRYMYMMVCVFVI